MPDVTDRVKPTKPVIPNVYVYIEGGNLQVAAANVPIWLHIMDKDNHEGINVEDRIVALFKEHQLSTDNVVEHWVKVADPGLDDHLDTTTDEEIPD